MKPETHVVQPSEVFKMLGISNTKEAHRVFETALEFLAYMKVNEELQTSFADFTKIAPDLIQMEVKIDLDQVSNSLEKKKIIKFPI